MSVLGQKRTGLGEFATALPPKADIDEMQLDVRIVAEADINPQSGSGNSGSWLSRLSTKTTRGLITGA